MKLIIDIARLFSKLGNAFRFLIATHIFHRVTMFFIRYIPSPILLALKPLAPILTNGFRYLKNIQAIIGTLLLFNLADLSSLMNPFELLNVLSNYATIVKTMFYNLSDKYLNIPMEIPKDQPRAKVQIDVEPPKLETINKSRWHFDSIPQKPTIEEPLFSLRDWYANGEIKPEPTFWDKYGTYISYGIAGIVIIGGIIYFYYTWDLPGSGKGKAVSNTDSGSSATNTPRITEDLQDGIHNATSRTDIQERLNRVINHRDRLQSDSPSELGYHSPSLSEKARIGLAPEPGSYSEAMNDLFQISQRRFPTSQVEFGNHSQMPTPGPAENLNPGNITPPINPVSTPEITPVVNKWEDAWRKGKEAYTPSNFSDQLESTWKAQSIESRLEKALSQASSSASGATTPEKVAESLENTLGSPFTPKAKK